jgi:hypothetical protein
MENTKMQSFKYHNNQLTALLPRKRFWILFIVLAAIPAFLSFIFLSITPTINLSVLLMSLGGWLFTFSGILFAGNQALRIALAESFGKLHAIESSPIQYHAKRLIYKFGRAIQNKGNRYIVTRNLINSLSKDKQIKIHEARRRLKHFWLLAEAYYKSRLMTASEIFAIAGSPEILLDIEPLESC